MENNNLKIYNQLRTPDKKALKKITGGRLKGMTDIKPQWRILKMTEIFGTIGFGWKYSKPEYTYQEHGDEVVCVCQLDLFVKVGDVWSEAIPGVGGSRLSTKESRGVYVSDEAEKMAMTDALSVSMKALGVAGDVYLGYSDSKYVEPNPSQFKKPTPEKVIKQKLTPDLWVNVFKMAQGEIDKGVTVPAVGKRLQAKFELTASQVTKIKALKKSA